MSTDQRTAKALSPSPYHLAVVRYLKRAEPEVWTWASSFSAQEEAVKDLRAALLRETYRLTPEAHGEVYAACRAVMAALEIEAEPTLFQAGSGEMNAALVYVPGQVNLVFHGPVLERLDSHELTALLGHELAHYRLWAADGGDYYTASRILDHTLSDPQCSASQAETARLYGLHTEIYADRGAALAAGAPAPAITTLVKVQTGLATVDAAAYLAQASELEAGGVELSKGTSHPETYIRAQAVDLWWREAPDLETWLAQRLHGPLSMASLDLEGQVKLEGLTRRFLARFLGDPSLRTEAVMTQVRAYFPDWRDQEPAAGPEELAAEQIDDSVRDYLGYVLLDLALADRDLRDDALLEAARLVRSMGGFERFLASLRKDGGLSKRETDILAKRLKESAA